MTARITIVELQRRAQRKLRQQERLRQDARYRAVLGAFVHAKLITTNTDIEPEKGPVALRDVLWAGKLEPRLLELIPAVILKKPSMLHYENLPEDLGRVIEKLRRNETPPDFRGVPGEKLQEWIPRVGHKGKLPTQLKAFRLRKDDVDLLEELASTRGLTETDVIRAGLRALAEN